MAQQKQYLRTTSEKALGLGADVGPFAGALRVGADHSTFTRRWRDELTGLSPGPANDIARP